jgi:hypothetical protein
MTLRQYLITMVIATLLCWFSTFFVLVNVDPFETTWLSFVFFYASLLLALIGTTSLIIFVVYHVWGGKELPLFRYVQTSFRQSLLVAVFLVLTLFLQGQKLLTIWNGAILGTVMVLILSFSFSVKRSH